MLVDVVIPKPIQTYLLHANLSLGVVATIVIQVKDDFYHNRYLANQFFPLTIEDFGCLH